MIFLWLILFIFVLLVGIFAWLYLDPVFGAKASKEQVQYYQQVSNYSKGKFYNLIPSKMEMGFSTMISILRDYIKGTPDQKPNYSLPVIQHSERASVSMKGKPTKMIWFGHSALFVEIEGKTLLLDPMLGNFLDPVPLFGGKRFSEQLPIEIEELPMIDAVVLSHDHYDHLDYRTIQKIEQKVNHFFVPLGVGSHLKRWGVAPEKISEHYWWQELQWDGLRLVCTPARHFSGRSVLDRDSTLWCSWVITGENTNLFFSGDSGYGAHFQEIGDKYGPFDVTFMECGQYDERWSAIHMMPEQTVQAHLDVKGKLLIPIHWGAFTLALHSWYDPIERATQEAHRLGVTISTPQIGESIYVGMEKYPRSNWWR